MQKVISSHWFTEAGNVHPIGIVVTEDSLTGKRKAYVGTGKGKDESTDTDHIVQYGAKLYTHTLDYIREDLFHV